MPDTTIVGRHVKRGADERYHDNLRDHYPDSPYIGLHQATVLSRVRRGARRIARACGWSFEEFERGARGLGARAER